MKHPTTRTPIASEGGNFSAQPNQQQPGSWLIFDGKDMIGRIDIQGRFKSYNPLPLPEMIIVISLMLHVAAIERRIDQAQNEIITKHANSNDH